MIKTSPILLEIFANIFISIGTEMRMTLRRTGYTIYTKYTSDNNAALANKSGEAFACDPARGLGGAAMPWKLFLCTFPEEELEEGDIIIGNDPYEMGGIVRHLPDICTFKPIFYKGEILCYSFAFIHCSDVGGAVSGSVLLTSYEIFQEGLRIPPLKLYKAGKLNEDFLKIFKTNVRIPDDNWGDLQAMVSALKVGEARILETVEKYGVETVKQAIEDVLEWAEQRAKKALEAIPDGASAEFTDYMEDDGVSDIPVRLKVRLTKKQGKLHIDWTGTDPQTRSSINTMVREDPHPLVIRNCYGLFTLLDPTIPINAGVKRTFTMHTPLGSVLNAEFPAAGAASGFTMCTANDAAIGALIQLLPGKLPAGAPFMGTVINVSEPDLKSGIPGKRNVMVLQTLRATTGGGPDRDGLDARQCPEHESNNPIEILETDCSVKIREYGIRIDSGGPGKYRGGNSCTFEFEARMPNTIITARGSGRAKMQFCGGKGGKPGKTLRVTLNPGTERERFFERRLDLLVLNPGDVVRFEAPAGGGYGNPLERDVDKVLYDVQQGMTSVEGAERDYGVILKDNEIDYEETKKLREEMMKSYEYKKFDYGPYRERYERVWTAEIYDEMVNILYSLPVDFRPYVKERLVTGINELTKQKEVDKSDLIREWERLRETLGIRG